MIKFPPEVLQTGMQQDPEKPVVLFTGGLSACYNKGSLRYIRSANGEVLRMIYPALRDRNWGTLKAAIRDEKIKQDKDGFSINYQADYKQGDISFRADYYIRGQGNNISFEMKGKALSGFLKNRIGLCILHPLTVSGRFCILHHTNGTTSRKTFPEWISPHQPFMDLKGMEWEYLPGKMAKLKFSGDIFETEDQRNWTDASFKTYSTPLSLPFPVKVEIGQYLEQSVHLTLTDVTKDIVIHEKIPEILIPATTGKENILPGIGICASGEHKGFTENEVNSLRKLNISHIRIEVKMNETGWEKKFEKQVKETTLLEKPVELILYLQKADELQVQKLKEILDEDRCALHSISCFDPESHVTGGDILEKLYPLLRQTFPDVPIGAGSNANFAALNRNRFKSGLADFLTFPVCPQVHNDDHLTLVENLEGQKHVVESARTCFPGLPVHISPVTLKRRFNPVASSKEQPEKGESLPATVDPRQMSLFCAGWTLGSMKMLAEAGITSATFYETMGMKGIIHGDRKPEYPGLFHAMPGMIYPAWYLLGELMSRKGWKVLKIPHPSPLSLTVLALGQNNDRFITVANLKQENNRVILKNLPREVRIFHLDEISFQNLMAHPSDIECLYNDKQTKDGSIILNMKPCELVFIRYRE